jgi:hypothetical protein
MTRMSGTSTSPLRPSSLGPQHLTVPTLDTLPIAQFSVSSLSLIQMIRATAGGGSPC